LINRCARVPLRRKKPSAIGAQVAVDPVLDPLVDR
jgi:hypothetical protein